MYKKITHHITEEHYDHPMAVEMMQKTEKVKSIATPKPNGSKKAKDYEIYTFPILKQIEKDSTNAWALLSWRIRSLVSSITSGDEDIDLLLKRAASDIDMIGSLLIPVYGADAAAKFSELLYAVVISLVDVIKQIKANKSTTYTTTKLNADTLALAEFAYRANPMWLTDVVVDIFTRVENLYIEQATYRLKKAWADEVASADSAYNIMVVKQDNGDASFADIFSAGIINDTVVEEIEDFLEA